MAMFRTVLTVSALALALTACSPDPTPDSNPPSTAASDENPDAAPSDDPSHAEGSTTDPATRSSPPDLNDSSAPSLTFHGYDCVSDCSGHQAGYDWAEEHGITDPDECGGNSESFIEGCKAYAGEEGPNTDSDTPEE